MIFCPTLYLFNLNNERSLDNYIFSAFYKGFFKTRHIFTLNIIPRKTQKIRNVPGLK